jgi:hypothetical protein
MKRRSFIEKASLGLGGMMIMPPLIDNLYADYKIKSLLKSAGSTVLPWDKEMSLKQTAADVFIKKPLNPTNPQPDIGAYPEGPSLQLLNTGIRSTIWGPANHVTISLTKNDVWDRRVNPRCYESPSLKEIIEGADSPANKDYTETFKTSTRPQWGYLKIDGGKFNPYKDITVYPFPMMKQVGQIILSTESLAGAAQPEISQCLDSGLLKFSIQKESAKAELEYILSMKNNVYAIKGKWEGVNTPVSLRLYRNKDTSYLSYMTADGKDFLRHKDEYEKDRSFNGPIEPPVSGIDGQYFWIRQQLPAENLS